jgi:hypothetical protein
VEDFQIEVFASAPVDGSSGDYADGRIVKYATHFYMWHDASGEWKKFGNSTDITSLETRLSVQESSQAVAEASMVAIDSSLQTRISTEEVARSSSIDSAETRAEAAEAVISGNLSSELVNRAVDVEAEASRATSAEAVLSANLSSEVSARIVDVEAEATRAGAAEGSLQVRLAAEESVELSAEGSLNTREGAEESARLAGDNSLASAISSEASLARAGEGSLETRLSSEEDRVDAILNASTADKNTFVETVSFINAIDVAHDSQTSTEISSIDAAIASAESARASGDSSLQTRLSSEESAEASAEASLNTRMAGEESIELSAEGSLDARMSAEESLRLAEDGSLETSLSGAGSARAAGDSSLTTAASAEASTARSAELSVQSSLSAAALARGTADTSLETRLSVEESAMIVAVDSIEALRSAGDLSLTTRVAAEESVEASAEASLDARISSAIAARNSEDDSLETRLIAEESNELSAETSLDSRVSSEASAQVLADGSLETRFSGEISVEKSKLDAILDSADADKDTFVEIVSFITSVDTESDDALASYVVTIDSAISTEASTARSAEAVLSAGVSSESSAMTSALAATYSVQKAAIDVHAGNITDAEQHEGEGRHMRIGFTSQTSFTVAAVDLPTNFEPGNGMVQVFQDMGSNKFRHLIAPASYNASTGAMSFDLGSTAKSGFVVFYSFAGDESSATEVQAFARHMITDASLSIGSGAGDTTSVTFDVSGVTASNVDSYYNYGTKAISSVTGSTGSVSWNSSYNLASSWDSGYTQLTISWSNPSTPSADNGFYKFIVSIGTMKLTAWFDSSTLAHDSSTASTIGYYIANNSDGFPISPPYMGGTGTATYNSYTTWGSYGSKYNRGPSWEIDASDIAWYSASALRNVGTYTGASNANNGIDLFYAQSACTFTDSFGTDYWALDSQASLPSTHHLYSEITGSRTTATFVNQVDLAQNTQDAFTMGYWLRNTGSNSSASTPGSNTTVTFYFFDTGAYGKLISSNTTQQGGYDWQATPGDATDIKIVIDTSDSSYDIYRNSNVGGSPNWVAVERCYLSNQSVS